MIAYPEIDPAIVSIGPLTIHWYGLMYLVGFAAAWWLGRWRAQRPGSPIKPEQVEDLIFYAAIGVIVGGRIGSVLFYNFDRFAADPLYLLRIWEGGMAFHGGFLGVLAAIEVYRRKIGCTLFEIADFIAPLTPIGLGAGRIGNFINGELWGGPSQLPWAMQLPCDRFPAQQYTDFAGALCAQARHPSQLYEFVLEGVVLFLLLWWFSAKQRPKVAVAALFLLGYGLFRSLVELVRLPDAHIGYLWGTDWVTMGLLLSTPMIIAGGLLMLWAYRNSAEGKKP